MKNPEYEKSEYESRDAGYSEKEMDLDIEIRAGEWQNLKKVQSISTAQSSRKNHRIVSGGKQ